MMQTAQMNPSSVFLVSGGAKGITAECAIELAQRQRCKFILLGRSEIEMEPNWARDCGDELELKRRIMEHLLSLGEKPTPKKVQRVFNTISSSREIKKTLSAIESAGGVAEYISVDVTDVVALKEKLGAAVERIGPIAGIIHGAGNLADKLIENKSEQDFETVYGAKVQGLENLLNCVQAGQLDYLVLFSSVVGFYGNIGQSDYAIANEILNKTAHLVKQHHPDCHVVAINWGPWESGMVTKELQRAYAQHNIQIIPMQVGTQMLANELRAVNHDTVQVVIGDPVVLPVGELNPSLRTHRIRRKLTLAANPFLLDHVVAGYPVLPFTCNLAWIVNACEQLYPGYKFFSCTNYKLLKGIVFDETLAREYILELKEIAKNHGSEIEFEAKILSDSPKQKIPYHYHYTGKIKLVREIPQAPTYDSVNLERDYIITDEQNSFYRNKFSGLFHGPAFQGVKRVLNITQEKITVECAWPGLSDQQLGQFPVQTLNPYITDIQLHPKLIWLQHFHQEKGLPSELPKLEHFAPIPWGETFYISTEIKQKTQNALVADVITHNLQGQVYSRILGKKSTIYSYPDTRN